MNRGDARTLLRRRINEPTADNWSDSILNTLLNLGYAFVLKQIRRVNKEAILFWEYRNTVAGSNWYEKPSNTTSIVEVGFKDIATDTDWEPLTRKPYYLARGWTTGVSGSETVYCHRGNYIGLFPAPTNSVTKGLRLLTVPNDQLTLDTDNFLVELTLQYAVVLYAAILAKGESPEDDAKDQRELTRLIGDIPVDYADLDDGQTIALNPDVSDLRGVGQIVRRGIDPGRV